MSRQLNLNFEKQFTEDAKVLNLLTFEDIYNRLSVIGLSLFEWKGLPESCNARYLEQALYNLGKAVFVRDNTRGYLTLKCNYADIQNVYGEPTSIRAYGIGYEESFAMDNCVIIRNNLLEKPTCETITLFANRLTEAERTIDVNIKSQKTPTLVVCDDVTLLSLKNIYADYTGNQPVLFGDRKFNPEFFKVLKTDAPYVADKLTDYKHDIWNEALNFFGVNNANTDKKERLISDEVNANNEQIEIMAEAMLLTRKLACEQINAMFPELKVSVELRMSKPLPQEKEDVEEDGESEEE